MAAEIKFTLIIDDPVSNSYIQNLYAPDPDPNMIIEEYVRSYEQNEDLGLNDIVVEGYEEQEEKDKAERDAAAAAPAAETTETPAVEKNEA
jgi:zinc finger protein